MKNLIFTLAIVLFGLNSNKTNAQAVCSGYVINNNLNCSITIGYGYKCTGGSTCGTPQTGININPGSSFTIPNCGAGCAPTGCEYVITLESVATNTTGLPVSVESAFPNGNFMVTLCSGSLGFLTWGGTSTDVD
ncbi:MAG: hypothetical protein JNK73_10365 [Bacteroidia bacterium]|nr:hypothetical protein [Bacteroidia bacterium]